METVTSSLRIDDCHPVVMVDDSEDDFFIAQRMFARSGLDNEFIHCPSAEHLISYLDDRLMAGDPMPALVLMDINMPGLNGHEATALLKSRAELAAIPVIALLTSSVDERDRRAAAAAGADGCFVKPMDLARYVDLFDSLAA